MWLFLHDRGYNFFNINRLTYSEINLIIKLYNKREAEKERDYNRQRRKSKRRR